MSNVINAGFETGDLSGWKLGYGLRGPTVLDGTDKVLADGAGLGTGLGTLSPYLFLPVGSDPAPGGGSLDPNTGLRYLGSSATGIDRLVTSYDTDPNVPGVIGSLVEAGSYALELGNTTGNGVPTLPDTPGERTATVLTQRLTNYTAATVSIDWKGVLYADHGPDGGSLIEFVLTDLTKGTSLVDSYVAVQNADGSYGVIEAGNALGAGPGVAAFSAPSYYSADGLDMIGAYYGGATLYTPSFHTESFAIAPGQSGDTFQFSVVAANCYDGGHPGYVYLDSPTSIPPTPAIAVDAQVSFDGSTWLDPGAALDDPAEYAGAPIYYRAIVTNTGTTSLSGVSLSSDQPGLSFGGRTLDVGESTVSDVVTSTAAAGHVFIDVSASGSGPGYPYSTSVTGTDKADYTGLTTGLTLDKQVSFDGSSWMDVGAALTDPAEFAGQPVYYRAIVTNTGTAAVTNVALADPSLPSLSFSGVSIAGSSSYVSPVAATTALAGYHKNTATVIGTTAATTYTAPLALTATDSADYTGLTAGVTVDAQVSFDGSTWLDKGAALDNPAEYAGQPIYYRAIVTNTGTASLSGVSLSSDQPGLSFAGRTIATGDSTVSDVVTSTAAAGHVFIDAGVTGTAAGYPSSTSVSATDKADYTGLTTGLTLDKQVSFDGASWMDAGSTLSDPAEFTGLPVYYRAIVTNSGTAAVTNVALADPSLPSLSFSGVSIAGSSSYTSSVAATTAAPGFHKNTATVTGTTVAGTYTAPLPLTATDSADYTGLTAAVAVDNQVSFDGSTWLDTGSALINPAEFVGQSVYFRAIVSNTGTTPLTGVALSDPNLPALAFSGKSIDVGGSFIASTGKLTATAGHFVDTATVTGTATGSTYSPTAPVTASDSSDYTGLTFGLTLDEQVSFDKVNWSDIGTALDDPAAFQGQPVYFRALVGNTGATAVTGVSVNDPTTGLAVSGVTIAPGTIFTSTPSTGVAGLGHVVGTATATGLATGSAYAAPLPVSATDGVDYTGFSASVAVDAQVSSDGTTWHDVASNRDDPLIPAGSPVSFRALVTNTGTAPLSALTLAAPGLPALSVTVPSLAPGASATSNTVAIPAVAGDNSTVITASATASAGAAGPTKAVLASDTAGYGSDSFALSPALADQADATSGTTPYTFTVTRTGSAKIAETLNYTIAGIGPNPAPASMFAPAPTTVMLDATKSSATLTIAVVGQLGVTADEGFSVTLTSPSGAAITTPTATGIIRKNSVSTPAFFPSVFTVTPTDADKADALTGTTSYQFTLARDAKVAAAATTMTYTVTSTGSNPADLVLFTQPTGPIEFAAGQTLATLDLGVKGAAITAPENFTVTVTDQFGNPVATQTGTIEPNFTAAPLPPGFLPSSGTGTSNGSSGSPGQRDNSGANTVPNENDVIRINASTVSVARFFDTKSGAHFFTGSAIEAKALAASGSLKSEASGLTALDPTLALTDANAVAVFRFFDIASGEHFYTDSQVERAALQSSLVMSDEGVAFYEHATAQAGDTAVYRFFDKTSGTHLYTADASERSQILNTRPDLVNEGIAFYAPKSS